MDLLEKASVILTPTAYNNGEALCVKPSDGSGDFDFSRNSAATRVNAQGLVENVQSLGSELVTNGDFDTDSDWTLIQATIANGVANFATTDGSFAGIRQNGIFTIGKTYLISLEVSNLVGTAEVNTNGGTSIGLDITSNGVKSFYMVAENTDIEIKRKFGSTNVSATIDNVSVKEVIDNTNLPRISYENFSYDGSGNIIPNSGCGSWLFEPQSTNLITYSSDFSQWTPTGTPIITSDYGVSPDGNQNSTRVEFDTDERIRSSFSASGDITFSVYLKGSGVITLRDNTNVYRQNVTLTSEWARYDLSFNATITSIQIQNQTASIVDCEIWGAQVEENSYPTSLIPTSGATVTRNQDVCTNGGSLATINSTEGTLYFEGAALTQLGSTRHISVSSGSDNNRLYFYYRGSGGFAFASFVGGVLQANITFSGIITNTSKIACKYKENDYALWVNGVEVGTDTSASVWSSGTLNTLNFNAPSSTNPFFGKTKCLAVWKEALSDSELQSLTTI